MFMQRQIAMRMGLTRRMLSTASGSSVSSAATTTLTESKEDKKLRIVVAVGGNALQRRGDRLTIENMLKAAAEMAPTMAALSEKHELGKRANQENYFYCSPRQILLANLFRSAYSWKWSTGWRVGVRTCSGNV